LDFGKVSPVKFDKPKILYAGGIITWYRPRKGAAGAPWGYPFATQIFKFTVIHSYTSQISIETTPFSWIHESEKSPCHDLQKFQNSSVIFQNCSGNFYSQEEKMQMETEKRFLKGINAKLSCKRLGEYLNAWVETVHRQLMCECALLTVQYDPNLISLEDSWIQVQELEKKTVDLLASEEDILYVLSSIETHPGSSSKKEEINENLKERGEMARTILESQIKTLNPEMYQLLSQLDERYLVQQLESSNLLKRSKPSLKDYPHIHMAVVFTTTTGKIRDLTEISRMLLQHAHDVDIRKKDGTRTRSSKKAGRTADFSNDAKILGYVMKNSRHEETYNKLKTRVPTVLYNFRQNSTIQQLYSGLYMYTPVILMENNQNREKIQKSQPMVPLFENNVPNQQNTSLSREITPKPVARTELEEMVFLVETYMEKHQLAITEQGSIYQRIPKSKQSWRLWGTSERMYRELTTRDTMELLTKKKSQYDLFTSGGYKNLLPYVNLDYKWIEFKDFFMHLPTGGVTKENKIYECFAFFPEIGYDEIEKQTREGPKIWMKILQNSEFIKDGSLSEEGERLARDIYGLMLPKTHKSKSIALHGEPNSGKSSLLQPIMKMYPEDVVMSVTKANGFELANLEGKQIIILDEFSKKDSGLGREKILKLAEGDIKLAVNRKHKDVSEVDVAARTAFISNDLNWAELEKANLFINNSPAQQGVIISKELNSIDPAYTARMNFYKMRSFPKELYSSSERKEMIEKEKGRIVLFLAKNYFGKHAFRLFQKAEDMKIYLEYAKEITGSLEE
jgi:hypothetical protein